MYLKSLEMQGFKSFPDKTKLTFERGTAVIVGPNGSGKSNISDAMRWVLGEISSKSLRGSKMEDIIFGGADSRRPMGFAEVSVTFDNTDPENRLDCPYDEVTVTRRYYRAGESEYFINRNACRLKDIYELFMNTGVGRDGYSIIGQGKIAEIISRKSEERRSIFEDASGIAKYRHRKIETERKLETTEENMTRVTDVFHEVEAQVGPLEKEAERAKKAIELQEVKKKVDVQLWLYDSERLQKESEKAEENFRNSGIDLKLSNDAIDDLNNENDRLYEEAAKNSADSAELQDKIKKLTEENSERTGRSKVSENNIEHYREKIASSNRLIESKNRQLEAEQENREKHAAAMAATKAEQDKQNAAYTALSEKAQALADKALDLGGQIATALADIGEREEEAVGLRVRKQVLQNNKSDDSGKNESMEQEIAAYRATSEKLAKEGTEKGNAAAAYQPDIDAASEILSKSAEELANLTEQKAEIEEKANNCKLEADLARQRADAFRAMEEHFEGYNGSVRFVMESYNAGNITNADGSRCGKIYGPLSKVITVEPRYVTAIEMALGNNLQHIVVEDENVAKAAIYMLKKIEKGRATFFPISSMVPLTVTKEMEEAENYYGYLGIASELVGCEKKFENVVSSLLGRTLVFDTLEHATEMAKGTHYRVKLVTLDGQIINAGGSFTGGSANQKGSVLSRAGEIAALDEKLKKLTGEQAKLTAELEKTEKLIKEKTDDKEDAENRKALLLALQANEVADANQINAKKEANDALIEKMLSDYNELNRRRAGYDEEFAKLELREKEIQHQISEISEARAEKDVERNGILDEKTAVEKEMTDLYIGISGLTKDMETEGQFIEESQARAKAIEEETAAERENIRQLEEQIKQEQLREEANRNTKAEGERVLGELGEKQRKLRLGGEALEKRRGEISQRLREKTAQRETIILAHSKNEEKRNSIYDELDKLNNRFFEDYEMTRNDALLLGYEPLESSQHEEAVALQKTTAARIRGMGPVDLDAVNKYKDVKARYDVMSAQIADMTAARDDLIKIIRDLENEMKSSFVETFNQINENFHRTFAELFGGGSAEVILSDPDNVLESGIEIKAAPPGKIIKNLVQLSGGEQSFVAIALFFAILQVNPTPFFILDEIEAALDEVNVARFAAYIKRYSRDTQFIIITHRRGTMEAANRLYGVTMPEHGISKVLALDVNSVSGKKEGDDWDGIFSEIT